MERRRAAAMRSTVRLVSHAARAFVDALPRRVHVISPTERDLGALVAAAPRLAPMARDLRVCASYGFDVAGLAAALPRLGFSELTSLVIYTPYEGAYFQKDTYQALADLAACMALFPRLEALEVHVDIPSDDEEEEEEADPTVGFGALIDSAARHLPELRVLWLPNGGVGPGGDRALQQALSRQAWPKLQ
ncbi:hypothetical protein MNEG_2249, partial [Monoraphidium neglectum]